jgi:hypothetical protein
MAIAGLIAASGAAPLAARGVGASRRAHAAGLHCAQRFARGSPARRASASIRAAAVRLATPADHRAVLANGSAGPHAVSSDSRVTCAEGSEGISHTVKGCWGVVYSTPQNGISPFDPTTAGGNAYDLADPGATHARFVKIVHRTHEACPDAGGRPRMASTSMPSQSSTLSCPKAIV